MALTRQSLFLFGLEVTENNSSIDFQNVALGPEIQATLRLGYYSLSALMNEIERAMNAADPANLYTVTADRTFSSGTQNRVTIMTSGSFLSLLFATGTRSSTTVAPLIGFPLTDQTGATSYQGTSSAGIVLLPEELGYTYLSPEMWQKVFGTINVSSSGRKEAVVFNIQKFWQVEFKYEPEAKVVSEWEDFFVWAIQQRLLEFTPSTSSPNTVLEGTLETTTADGKALSFKMQEQLPEFPFFYTTGMMTFRLNIAG